jgi:bacillithiol system protein YtxJ
MITWLNLIDEKDLFEKTNSTQSVILFKHSERCSVSRMAKRTFEDEYEGSTPVYLIHVIDERPISNKITEITGVTHQSPQLLVMRNGKCLYHASHDLISADAIKAFL